MSRIALRPATAADVPWFDRWDYDTDVIAATSDDSNAAKAFESAIWAVELAAQSDVSRYYVAELDGRPISAMQIIDPHREPTQYWGDIAPNLRAIDIWIGAAADRGHGHRRERMRLAQELCFADPRVSAIVIEPLASNERAHRFYQRLGYRPLGRRFFADDDCLVHEFTRADWAAAGRD